MTVDRDQLDGRIAELEAISRERDFTDAEIDEFMRLIRSFEARERERKKNRARKLQRINRFLART